MNDLADYTLAYYGRCDAPRCLCRDPGPWLGTGCPHWRTLGVKTWEELRQAQAALRAEPQP